MKPVTFSIDYELEHPENGPMLDDGWPTSLKVSVGSSTHLPGCLLPGHLASRFIPGYNICVSILEQ